MNTDFLSLIEVKRLSLVDYLAYLGFFPEIYMPEGYWYQSPLREDQSGSFKVNWRKNTWYDHGTNESGTIIDFGVRYHRCTASEFLEKLNSVFSFHRPDICIPYTADQKKKIKVIAASPVTNPALCRYLHNKGISLKVARAYCKEIRYRIDEKISSAIGFLNDSMGYELRSSSFNGAISPRNITTIPGSNSGEVAVFEDFISFFSYLELLERKIIELPDFHGCFLILNRLTSLPGSRRILDRFQTIHLFLDNDEAGSFATEKAILWNGRCIDERFYLHGCADFNELLAQATRPARPQIKLT